MRYLASFFCNRETGEEQGQNEGIILPGLPETIKNIQSFTNGIRNKLGLLILYKENNIDYLEDFFTKIKSQEYIVEIIVFI
jgi:hypothetical protein